MMEMFRTGSLATLRHSFRAFVELRRIAQQPGQVRGALLPRHPATGNLGTLASGMAYCITQKSDIPLEVFQWMKFMSSREMGVQMFLGDYAQPGCRTASWKDPRILESFPICAQVADAADTAEVEQLPWNLRTPECLAAWRKGIGLLLAGDTTPDECAKLLTRDVNKVLALPR